MGNRLLTIFQFSFKHHRAQLFKGRLALTQNWILIQVSLFLCPRVFKGKFSPFFLEHPMIKLEAKKIWTEISLKAFIPEIKSHTNPELP